MAYYSYNDPSYSHHYNGDATDYNGFYNGYYQMNQTNRSSLEYGQYSQCQDETVYDPTSYGNPEISPAGNTGNQSYWNVQSEMNQPLTEDVNQG